MQTQFGTMTDAARYALAARRGVVRPEALHGTSRDMFDTLTLAEIEEMTPAVPDDPEERFNDVPV